MSKGRGLPSSSAVDHAAVRGVARGVDGAVELHVVADAELRDVVVGEGRRGVDLAVLLLVMGIGVLLWCGRRGCGRHAVGPIGWRVLSLGLRDLDVHDDVLLAAARDDGDERLGLRES